MTGAGWPYYAFLGVASGHLGWQIWTVDVSSRSDCNRKYVWEDFFHKVMFERVTELYWLDHILQLQYNFI